MLSPLPPPLLARLPTRHVAKHSIWRWCPASRLGPTLGPCGPLSKGFCGFSDREAPHGMAPIRTGVLFRTSKTTDIPPKPNPTLLPMDDGAFQCKWRLQEVSSVVLPQDLLHTILRHGGTTGEEKERLASSPKKRSSRNHGIYKSTKSTL